MTKLRTLLKLLELNDHLPMEYIISMIEAENLTDAELLDEEYMRDKLDIWDEMFDSRH